MVVFAVEMRIMDTSKGSPEPVRGSKLPVKVGQDMTPDKVCVLAQKKAFRFQLVFIGVGKLRSFFYHDIKFVCHIPNTDEPFTVAKHEKVLGRAYSKNDFN